MPAFDATRPPSMEVIEDCVHCGFCLPTCPTYLLWGEEMDSPRGRIVLMRAGLEEDDSMSEAMVTHFDRCLGCMACVTSCPSGVRYDRLIETTRPQVERNFDRSLRERLLRKAVFGAFTHPGRMRALVPFVSASRRLGLTKLATSERIAGRWPRLASLASLAPDVRSRDAFHRLPPFVPGAGTRRGLVGLLQGCVQRAFFPGVNAATARVLSAEGFDVAVPKLPACCGALMMHTGYEDEAKEHASRAIEIFESCDYVVTNAAGCGSAMKDYRFLFEDDPHWGERAAKLSDKVRDVSELLVDEPRARRHPVRLTVAYHDACHLAHAQQIRNQPRDLLRSIPDLELVEPDEWAVCCGSAGIYNLLEPDAARALGERKAANLMATRPDAIAAGNPGCTLQIRAHLTRAGSAVPVYHPIELLERSLSAGD